MLLKISIIICLDLMLIKKARKFNFNSVKLKSDESPTYEASKVESDRFNCLTISSLK